MNARRQRVREDMERRFYRLQQFLGCYLHEDWAELHGTPEKAVDAAIGDYPIEYRQQVRRELAAVLAETPDDADLRKILNEGLGVNVLFKHASEARSFAEEIERKLLMTIKAHFERDRGGSRSGQPRL